MKARVADYLLVCELYFYLYCYECCRIRIVGLEWSAGRKYLCPKVMSNGVVEDSMDPVQKDSYHEEA